MGFVQILRLISTGFYKRIKKSIPQGKRSKIIVDLIDQKINNRKEHLRLCALVIEQDDLLEKEIKCWETTISDGLDEQ